MSHQDLANAYRESILAFVWRQWGQMGISASVHHSDRWSQDPEALLLFSLEVARWEPRMFDEILDWLAENGQLLMRQRVTNLLKRDPAIPANVVEAALEHTAGARVVKGREAPPFSAPEPLFLGRYVGLAKAGEPDPVFHGHGLVRPLFHRSGKSGRPDLSSPFNLAFRFRAIFGASSRSEALRFLLLHREHRAATAEVAEASSLSRYGVHQALEELAASRVIRKSARTRKDLRWWIESASWLDWLQLDATDLPQWVDWPHVYHGLAELWRWLSAPERETESPYIRASRARELMECLRPQLGDRGLDWMPSDAGRFRGELYWRTFASDIRRLIAALESGRVT